MSRTSMKGSSLPRAISWSLVALLTLGVPGPGLSVFASEPAAPEPAAAAFAVASDPAGASVYFNGELRGETPLTLEGVAPGEHRLRLVKPGYLENSRVVTLEGGRPGAVEVRMTPALGEARYTVQQEPGTGGGGGGSKKALWIGLGVVAVGAGAFLLLRDTNKAPTPGTISVSPTGTGMAGATSFTFTSSASDPDGDSLTFSWNFGDGGSGSGQTTNHVYASPGGFQVTLTVSDGKKSATANANVTVAQSLAGRWTGGRAPGFANTTVELNLGQSGSSLSGSTVFAGGLRGTLGGLTGSVNPLAYPTNVTWQTPNFSLAGLAGSFQYRFSGTVDASGNTMSGTLTLATTAFGNFPQSTTFRR